MKRKILDRLIDISFLIPAFALFSFIILVPFFRGVGISMTNWNGISNEYDFIGLGNYRILVRDSALLNPIKNTLIFTVLSVVFVNILGLLMAIGINNEFKGSRVLKSIYFLPITVSIIFSAYIWTYIYTDVFPRVFGISGLLGNPSTVMLGISIMSVWRDSGFAMVTYYAGIKSVPRELLEAARVDGAAGWKRFWNVTFPTLAPAITVNVTLFLGWGLKVFEQPMAATKGGPGRASETLALYVYNYTFPYNKAGYGQAAAIVMMFTVFVITALITSFLRKREMEM